MSNFAEKARISLLPVCHRSSSSIRHNLLPHASTAAQDTGSVREDGDARVHTHTHTEKERGGI